MTAAVWGVVIAAFVACFVEMVEATTIVLAMGFTRGWRSALLGAAAAVVALAVCTLAAGYAITRWLPESVLQLVVGCLLLIFGLQWLRKAILRAAGRKAVHDEDAIYAEHVAEAETVEATTNDRIDMFGFIVSFKGVFLEGTEVVFIVITFGLNAHNVPAAALGAVGAIVVVPTIAVLLKRPLSMINENMLKYVVGLMLASFGTYWSVAGVGVFRAGHEVLAWPGHDLAILVLLAVWFGLSRLFVAALRTRATTGEVVAS
ncbi:MAG TPA: hypothetical protein VH333_05435 [Pseudonocardiaceae bacterium]|nr:hypothetical protein [Pseudonocardiaceae bacterium]